MALYSIPFLRVLTLRVDEGWCLTDAARVYHGQVPFRDFFEIVGPGTFYWIALFLNFFGETWLATRACSLVTGTATAILLCFLARRLKAGSEITALVFWLAISFPEWPAVNHHLVANLFALAAFGMLLWWLDGGPSGILFLCGMSVGITFSTMLPKGLLLCVALIAILVLQGTRRLRLPEIIQLLGGIMAVILAAAGYFWARGSLQDLYNANFVWPARNYSEINAVPYGFGLASYLWRTFEGLAATLHPVAGFVIALVLWVPFAVVFLLPLILLALALYLRRSSFTQKTIPYWIAGSALWISEAHRPDMIHLVLASPVFIVLFFSLVSQTRLITVRLILMASGSILAGVDALLCLTAPVSVTTPVGSVAEFGRNPIIDFTNSHVRPGESMFVYPYSPMYYFLARAVNPTRFSHLLYGYHTREQMREAIRSLERDRTKYVIWDTTFETVFAPTALPSYRPPPETERIMEPYLSSRYTEIGSDGGIRFMERKRP